jgi:hypothetical protein
VRGSGGPEAPPRPARGWRKSEPRRRPRYAASVSDALTELSARLQETAERLRSGELEPDAAAALIEECAQLAAEAGTQVQEQTRAAVEPLPDLPGQLPLPSS